MIINIRGTSGSGKSHLVRRIMALYPRRAANLIEGRRQPISYILGGAAPFQPAAGALFVLGHYEVEGGGADNVAQRDQAFGLLRDAAALGIHVLWEGVVYSDEVTRTVALAKEHQLTVIRLNTPLEQCVASINERRARAGRPPLPNTKNTEKRVPAIKRACERLARAGVKVEVLGREEAFLRCVELFGLSTSLSKGLVTPPAAEELVQTPSSASIT